MITGIIVPQKEQMHLGHDIDSLIADLQDSDPGVRCWAAANLGLAGNKRAVEPLIVALQDSDSDVVEDAAISLGLLRDERAIAPLIRTLAHTSSKARAHSAGALREVGDARAVEPLIQALLCDSDSLVRMWAAFALGMGSLHFNVLVNDGREVPALTQALNDPDPKVCAEAARALECKVGWAPFEPSARRN